DDPPLPLCKQADRPVRAVRTGLLVRADQNGNHRVILQHEPLNAPAGQRTHYLHMWRAPTTPLGPATPLPIGTMVNQGAPIVVMGQAGNVPCHLHLEVSNSSQTEFTTPLFLAGHGTSSPTFDWYPPSVPNPVISEISLRGDRRYNAS